jgi:hypothetical protein
MSDADKITVMRCIRAYQRETGPKAPGRPKAEQTRDALAFARQKLLELDAPFEL